MKYRYCTIHLDECLQYKVAQRYKKNNLTNCIEKQSNEAKTN